MRIAVGKTVEMAQAILAQQEPEAKRKSGDELYEQFKSWLQARIHSFDIYYNGQTKNVSVVHRTPERFGAIVDDLVYVDPKMFDAFVEKEAGLASDIGRKMLYDIGVLSKKGNSYTQSKYIGGLQRKPFCREYLPELLTHTTVPVEHPW